MAAKRSSPRGLERAASLWRERRSGEKLTYIKISFLLKRILYVCSDSPLPLSLRATSQPAACSPWAVSMAKRFTTTSRMRVQSLYSGVALPSVSLGSPSLPPSSFLSSPSDTAHRRRVGRCSSPTRGENSTPCTWEQPEIPKH